jgi:arginyl-tRNA--protein-N-Asp/Glu arginylyltransferase
MKLLFSEAKSDYGNYIFPYAIWGFLEPGETPASAFANGFLPSSYALDRFYLCRQIRVDLSRFAASSENRRILRKGEGISVQIVPRPEFEFTPERRAFCKTYADAKFRPSGISLERLDALMASKIVTHILVYTDTATQREVGLAILYLEEPTVGFYYYAFYNLDYFNRSLGMFMMTSAVTKLAERGLRHLHLGTCYSANALYKFQFEGAEFFNGARWSPSLKELRYLVDRDQNPITQHLLETLPYREQFGIGDLRALTAQSPITAKATSP